jgi:hypothetical protein
MLTVALFVNSSPLLFCIITILQCGLISWLLWFSSVDVWIILLLLIIYFGGVIVLLIYICVLAQSDSLILKINKVWVVIPVAALVDCSLPRYLSDSLARPTTRAVFLFRDSNWVVVCVLIVYLLVRLLVVVKITKFYRGALRRVWLSRRVLKALKRVVPLNS